MISQTGHWLHPDAQSLSLLLMIRHVPSLWIKDFGLLP
jgi:hypothetical protein